MEQPKVGFKSTCKMMGNNTVLVLVTVWGCVAGPSDYTGVSRQLSFQPGGTELCTTINIINDVILEDSETFSVQLTATDQAVILNPSSATVSIIDNDGESGSISCQSHHMQHNGCFSFSELILQIN